MSLILDNCHAATMDEIEAVKCPKATKTWKPIPHKDVIALALEIFDKLKLKVLEQRFALSGRKTRGGNTRLFCEFILGGTSNRKDIQLVGAVRSSIDKSLTFGYAGGDNCIICGNLILSGEFMDDHRHTCVGDTQFKQKMTNMVQLSIDKFDNRLKQIDFWKTVEITEEQVNQLIMQCFRRGAFGCNMIPNIIGEWEKPRYDEFKPRTVWSLHNAYTEAHKRRSGDPIRNAEGSVVVTQSFTEAYPRIEEKKDQ